MAQENERFTSQRSDEMPEIKMLSYWDIMQATNGCNPATFTGTWRFGNLYGGYLNGSIVTVKMLAFQIYHQDEHDFLRELEVLKGIRHPNLMTFVGACVEVRALVYELGGLTSLDHCLCNSPQMLTWQIRARIVNQLCSVLALLYSNRPHPIFHGNIDALHVFLDANLHVKVLIPEGTPSTNPNPKGKFTEYLEVGNRKLCTDVYSLGIMILGLLTGLPDSRIQEELHDAHKEEWVKRNVDLASTGGWPLQLAKKLAFFGSKFCNNSSIPLTEVVADLRTLSAAIETPAYSDSKDEKKISSKNFASSSGAEVDDNKQPSKVRETTSRAVTSNVSSNNEASRFKMFTQSEIYDATDGLNESMRIGKGGYGSVYVGLLDNLKVAIKMLDSDGSQGSEEFMQELHVLGEIRHPNLVRLVGANFKLRSLVYEFLPNGSLEDCLKKRPEVLTWQMRVRIVSEICSGLIFLHSQSQPMVHGDLKPDNILMDSDFTVKLADFGLCRLLPEGSASATVAFHVTKNIKGTEWYIDPDFLESGKVTPGCDVYAFGVTILRLVTGWPVANILRKVGREHKRKRTMTIVDRTAGVWPDEVADYLVFVGLECCEPDRKCSKLMREMSLVLKDMLENKCA